MPPATDLVGEWISPVGKPNVDQHKWKLVKVSAYSLYNDNYHIFNKYSYGLKNYLGKNLMN